MAEAANDTVTELHEEQFDTAEQQPIEQPHDDVVWELEEDDSFAIEGPSIGERLPLFTLALLAALWTGFVGWAAFTQISAGNYDPIQIANWIAIACIPLALFGVTWLLLRGTSHHEALRFGRTAEAMRSEAERLDASIHHVKGQVAEMQGAISRDADRLMALGEEAAGRLGSIGTDLRDAGDIIEERATLLDSTAKSAREDVEVLLADLPRAERQARAASAGLKEAGVNAHEQAVSLDAQLSALTNRAREAEEIAGGAAQRLAANLSQIEGITEISSRKIDETGEHINAAVETALEQSSSAVEDARKAMDEIGKSLASMVESARISLEDKSSEAAATLDERIGAISSVLDALDGKLGGLEARVGAVNEDGAEKLARLGETVGALQTEIITLGTNIGGNDEATSALIARADEVKTAFEQSASALQSALPEAITDVEARTVALRETVVSVAPEMESLKSMAGDAKDYISVSSESLSEQRETIDAFVHQIGERIAAMREDIGAIETSLTASDEQARSIANAAAPQLIEALLRVRETADQAAEKARAAFGDVIPQSAAALSEATELAMNDVLGDKVEGRISELNAATERAVAAARDASEQLAVKMAEIETASAAIETRIEEGRAESEAADMDSFARRVTLLIESLNSTAIDVTKILSNDVTDTAWAAYLKGDRGIFARRAVRLLDSGEAREIAAQYEMDSEFAEQVNRYVHDFEAMLRRVLATRDGSPLAVTLLSSDNGKLYVALAQAIERFRD